MYGEWEKSWASSTLALVGCFRVTSHDSPKWRACSRANPRPTPRPEEKITQPLSQGPLISGRERTLATRGWIVLPQELITQNEQLTFTSQWFIFTHHFTELFPAEMEAPLCRWGSRFEVYDVKKKNFPSLKRQKIPLSGLLVLLTGLRDFKDIVNSSQNCSKNRLDSEYVVTRLPRSCSLWVLTSLQFHIQSRQTHWIRDKLTEFFKFYF